MRWTFRPFRVPHNIQSAAEMECPTKNVRNARWSSRESKDARISGKAVIVRNVVESAKNADVFGCHKVISVG